MSAPRTRTSSGVSTSADMAQTVVRWGGHVSRNGFAKNAHCLHRCAAGGGCYARSGVGGKKISSINTFHCGLSLDFSLVSKTFVLFFFSQCNIWCFLVCV